nr:unnamed protein product [Callosobruchus chinensis]CAH7744313.1 unnamed protein product [Callosobruchus chinensis]
MHILMFLKIVWSHSTRPLKLHEPLEELEHSDRIPIPPDGEICFLLKTENDDITDCDLGDEEFTTMAGN